MARKTRKSKKLSVHINFGEVVRGVWQSLRYLLSIVLLTFHLNPISLIWRRHLAARIRDKEGTVLYSPSLAETVANLFTSEQRRRRALVAWAQEQVPTMAVTDLLHTWSDGTMLCALVEAVHPGACPRYDLLKVQNKVNNCRLGLKLVAKNLKIPMTLISPEEMALPLNDQETERKIVQLLQLIRWMSGRFLADDNPPDRSSLTSRDAVGILRVTEPCTAKGTGLVVGVMGKISKFNVFFTTKETLSLLVRISDPEGEVCDEKIAEFNRNRRSSLLPTAGQSSKIWSLGTKTIQLWRQSNGLAAHQGNTLRKIPFDYQCLSEGHIVISYIPRASGTHTVEVMWQGQHIRCSPYSVRVVGSIEQLTRQSTAGRAAVKKVCFQNEQSQDNQTSGTGCHRHTNTESRESIRQVPNSLTVKTPKLHKQATITRRRVLRRIMTKAGQEIVIHETPSPTLRDSPCNQGGFQVPQRLGSPSPKHLPSGGSDYDSESTIDTPIDDNISVLEKFQKAEVVADAMVHKIMNSVLESVEHCIAAKQEVAGPSSFTEAIMVPVQTRRTSPTPSQFSVVPVKEDEILKKPIPIRGNSIQESPHSERMEVSTHTSLQPNIFVSVTPTSPALNLTPSRLTVPLNDNNFKSGPYSRSLSPFSRGRYEDESESYTSESESFTSKEGSETKSKGGTVFPKYHHDTHQIKEETELDSTDEPDEAEFNNDVVSNESHSEAKRRADEIFENFNNTIFTKTNDELVKVRTQIKSTLPHKSKVIRRRDYRAQYGNDDTGSRTKTKETVKKTLSDPTKHRRLALIPTRSKTISTFDMSDSTDSTSDKNTEDEIPLKCIKSESLSKSCYYISHKAFDSTYSIPSQNSLEFPFCEDKKPPLQLSMRRFSNGCKRKLAVSSSLPSLSKNWSAFEYDPGEEPSETDNQTLNKHFNLPKRASLASTDLLYSISDFSKNYHRPFNESNKGRKGEYSHVINNIASDKQRESSSGNSLKSDPSLLELPEKKGDDLFEIKADNSDNMKVIHDMPCQDDMSCSINAQCEKKMESTLFSNNVHWSGHGLTTTFLETDKDTKRSTCDDSQNIVHDILTNENQTDFNFTVSACPGTLDPSSCYKSICDPPLYGSPPPMAQKTLQNLTSIHESKQVIVGEVASQIIVAVKEKIDRGTQVSYSEIKEETKWRSRVLNNPQLRHRRTPQKIDKLLTNTGIKKNDAESVVLQSTLSKNVSSPVHIPGENEENLGLPPRHSILPTQPMLAKSVMRPQMTFDTSDSGIQDDQLVSSPSVILSVNTFANHPSPHRPCPRYVSGHQVLARRIYRRQTSIDDTILQHNGDEMTGKTAGFTLAKLTKAVSGIKRFKENASKDRHSGSGRRGNRCSRVGLHRRRVTFSRRVMIHRRSSSRSSRSSRQTGTLESRKKVTSRSVSKENVNSSADSQSKTETKCTLDSLSEFIAATSNVPQHMRKFDVANWVSKTINRFESNDSSSSRDLCDDLAKHIVPKCPSCRFKEGLEAKASTALLGAMISPTMSCSCEANGPSVKPKKPLQSKDNTLQCSIESNYSGFGVSASRRNELVSEILAFGNILTNTDTAEGPGTSTQRSMDSATSADLPDCNMDKSQKSSPDGQRTPSSYDSEVARLTHTSSTESPANVVEVSPLGDIRNLTPSSHTMEDEGDLQEWIEYVMKLSTSSLEESPQLDSIEEAVNESYSHALAADGGPCTVGSIDAGKVMAYGAGLLQGIVATSNNFQVQTDGAGAGSLSVSIQGPLPYSVLQTDVTYTTDNLYEVIYVVQHPGMYQIHVRWSDTDIPCSPFTTRVGY